jgi:LysR family transcriptional regulator, hypochlorite-specific transcription factor HypT
MELKWLEDFLSVAKTRSFSRSAEARHVTQSAFSRRIQALENWLGVALIDRSTYPTTLTPAGREFRETAEEAVRALLGSRNMLQASSRPNPQTVAVAALHSLALAFFPRWFKEIEGRTGGLNSRLLPDDFHNCIQALVEGGYDFLLTFHHSNVPILLDPEQFPHRVVGTDSMVAVRSPDLSLQASPWPLLSYAQNSFLGRIAVFAQAHSQPDSPPASITHINENAMAEALKVMALEGHGLAWLPGSLVARELADGRLVTVGEGSPLEIRLYRNAAHRRSAVSAVWEAAGRLAAQTMQEPNKLV